MFKFKIDIHYNNRRIEYYFFNGRLVGWYLGWYVLIYALLAMCLMGLSRIDSYVTIMALILPPLCWQGRYWFDFIRLGIISTSIIRVYQAHRAGDGIDWTSEKIGWLESQVAVARNLADQTVEDMDPWRKFFNAILAYIGLYAVWTVGVIEGLHHG